MCGIVYAHDFTGAPVNNGILQQFDKQRARGTEGFGLFDGLHLVRAAREEKILKWLVKYDSDLLLFHHRNPTSTINVKRAAHPFSTKDYFGDNQYIMVHNGVITNEDEMHKKHEEMGIQYQSKLKDGTFNDSEALAWELALTLEGKQEKLEARGGIAFVCMKLVKGKLSKLYFGRNSSPLNMYRDKRGIALSSEGPGESIESQKLYTFNYDLKRLTSKDFDVPRYATYVRDVEDAGRWESGYDDYGNYSQSWRKNRDKYGVPQIPYAGVGNAVDSYLDRQYGNSRALTINEQGLLEFDSDGSYIEDEEEYGNYIEENLTDTEMRQVEASISKAQVENKLFDYLCTNKGVLHEAYIDVEDDYQLSLCQDSTPENYRDVVLLEKIMETLCDDPEYRNEKSISSIWRAVWDN